MYTNNNLGSNKQTSSFENTITVTPIKVELDMSHSYPTPGTSGSSVAMAATTSSRRGTQPNSVSITNITTSNYVGTPNRNTGALPKEKVPKTSRPPVPRKPPPTIDTFWPTIMTEVRNIQQVDAKHQSLPLARIKKIMKLDESAKMIAAEAPLLFAKASEYFIQELTMRAWIHTEESKRRTLQRSDIAQAIANYDQFDFLIDIVPREDIKPPPANHKKETNSSSANSSSSNNNSTVNNVPAAPTATVTLPTGNVDVKLDQEILQFTSLTPETITINAPGQQTQTVQAQALPQQQQLQIIQQTAAATAQPQQLQYFITIPGVGQQANAQPQIVQQLHMPQQQLGNSLTPQLTSLNLVAAHHQPQQLILTTGPNGQLTATPATTAAQQTLAAAQQHQQQQQQQQQNQQQQQQQIQLMQQVMTPTGELTNVPITINANQLNLLRLQMQQQQQPQQQQVLIPTQCLTTQPLLQLGTVNATVANHNAQMIQQHQQPQQQQQQHIQQQQHHHQQQQQQQHNTNDNANIFINTPQANSQATTTTTNAASIVSTDRNLGSTYRPNC